MIADPFQATVATQSREREAMGAGLELIADVRAGLPAMRAKAGKYLPRYESEDRIDYQRRVADAPWRPEFQDALLTLASKPFSKAISFPDGTPDPILKFANDVDGRGTGLHPFARRFFLSALADGVALILVDYPKTEGLRTLSDVRAAGARPYWSFYPAESIVALRTEMRGGRRTITHLRLREKIVEPDGWGEREIDQVRVMEPGHWETWRRTEAGRKAGEWELYQAGPIEKPDGPQTGVDAVLLFTGERMGDLLTRPPLLDLAHMQVELFRGLSRQEEILTYSGSPMLSASGVSIPDSTAPISVGPKNILYAPPSGDGRGGKWEYVQPDARVLREVRAQVASVIADMQRIGLQPMFNRAGSVTATEVALSSAKAHSALEAWAIGLQDALEQALALTIGWMQQDDRKSVGDWIPTVDVHHDFSSDVAVAGEAALILDAQAKRIISSRTARDELARRGVLGPAYDHGEEDNRLRGDGSSPEGDALESD